MNKELLKGTTELMILNMLKREPMYGYGMIKNFELMSKGTFQFKEGTLYPILHALEKKGHIQSYWEQPETGRKRKYYRITEGGLGALETKAEEWKLFSGALNGLLGSEA